PGMWFEKNQKIYVSLPGVPHEMKEMMTRYVIPRLPDHFKMPFILSRTLLTAGIGESFLADLIKDFEQALPSFIKLAYLPQLGMVRLRLTAIGEEKEVLEKVTDQLFAELKEKVKAYLVTGEDETLSQVIGNILKASGKTLATAESCTGGYIAHLITAIPGAS